MRVSPLARGRARTCAVDLVGGLQRLLIRYARLRSRLEACASAHLLCGLPIVLPLLVDAVANERTHLVAAKAHDTVLGLPPRQVIE